MQCHGAWKVGSIWASKLVEQRTSDHFLPEIDLCEAEKKWHEPAWGQLLCWTLSPSLTSQKNDIICSARVRSLCILMQYSIRRDRLISEISIFSKAWSSSAAAAVLSKKLTFVGQNCYSDKNREQSSFPLSYNQQWCILYDIFFSKSEPHYFMPPAGHALDVPQARQVVL